MINDYLIKKSRNIIIQQKFNKYIYAVIRFVECNFYRIYRNG